MNRVILPAQNAAFVNDIYRRYQSAMESLQSLASLGGDSNYILSGCVVNGTSVSSGMLVIAGEVVPFAGGTLTAGATMVVTETETLVTVGAGSYTTVDRVAQFGIGAGAVGWGTLTRMERGAVQVGREVRMMLKGRSIGVESLRVEGCVYGFWSDPVNSKYNRKTITAGSVYIPSLDKVLDVPAHEFQTYGEPALPHRWKVTTDTNGYQYATLNQRAVAEPDTFADNLNRF